MQIEIQGRMYTVNIVRKNNRNTYIRVKNGIIVVTTNYFTNERQIKKLIVDNEKSIVKMLNLDDKKQEKQENFYFFGKQYDLIYGFDEIEFTDNKVYAPNKVKLDKYLHNEAKKIYQERLNYWYNVFEEKIPVPILKIRNMSSRWGVCNIKSHNVTLNYQLIKYDITCLDYVIVHELSHFIYHDHQKDFWNLVGKYYPKYKEARKMLKE